MGYVRENALGLFKGYTVVDVCIQREQLLAVRQETVLTSKAHSVWPYYLFQSSRDFACHLMQKLHTRMQQGQKLMQKYSATSLDKAMWCWQYSQIRVRYQGRYNKALYTLHNIIICIFSIPLEFSDFSLSSASETSDSSFSSSASTIILDDVPSKRQRIEDTRDAVSAEQVS